MEILHFKELGGGGGYRKCCHECSLGVNLQLLKILCVPSDALPLYQILKQSDNWLWRFGGYSVVLAANTVLVLRVSNFNGNVSILNCVLGENSFVYLRYLWHAGHVIFPPPDL